MTPQNICGLTGDSINFVAAVLLVIDPALRSVRQLKSHVQALLPPDVPSVEPDGSPTLPAAEREKKEADAESLRSKWAFVLLFIGFSLLLAARILEIRAAR